MSKKYAETTSLTVQRVQMRCYARAFADSRANQHTRRRCRWPRRSSRSLRQAELRTREVPWCDQGLTSLAHGHWRSTRHRQRSARAPAPTMLRAMPGVLRPARTPLPYSKASSATLRGPASWSVCSASLVSTLSRPIGAALVPAARPTWTRPVRWDCLSATREDKVEGSRGTVL